MSYRHKAYSRLDAPYVEVLHRGAWCPGTLHEWRQDRPDGPWHGWVRYHVAPGDNRIGTFHHTDIRPVASAHHPTTPHQSTLSTVDISAARKLSVPCDGLA